MIKLRVLPAVFACVSLLTLSACGGEDESTTAGSTPSGAATSAAAESPSAAPATSAAVETVTDKKLCESAEKASADLRASFIKVMSSGEEPSPADFQKLYDELEKEMSAVAASGGADSEVAAALTAFGAEAGKAAAAADPAATADNPAFEKAGTDITAACKKVGVSVNF
ncbi:hypothetical protein GA0070616_1062 [Micromonospora nigra]|uniref:Lipoprotein n=1 Tax=Micromonospora nigra TaxID=145857 RepID=A0A1C6RHD9_9ACTN|nr:hypothetical protein [Micromonospora nigra]SCL16605.1 hypothetical protein GA0070616_1062 [Micromonospora nigra]